MAVDIIIIIFVAYLTFQGYRKGFIKTLFDTIGVIVSFFLSKEVFYYVENFLLKNTKLFVKLHDFFETKLSKNILINANSNIPIELHNFINKVLTGDGADKFAVFVDNISLLVIRSISFIITFLTIYAALVLLSNIINTIMKLPLLNITNRLFGALIGVLKGVILLYLIFALATPLISFTQDKPITQTILNSQSSTIFYENNIILNYLSYKGFYDN